MGFWVAFAVSIFLSVVSELIRPKQAVPNALASAMDEFDLPTIDAGRVITVWAGKLKITGSNVVAFGNLKVTALTRKVKTGMFSSSRQTYAYQYRMGVQHVIGWGRPDAKVHAFIFDNLISKPTSVNNPDGSVTYTFKDENLFGGNEDEGGVSGVMTFYPGNETQLPSAYLANLVKKAKVPAYKRLCYLMLHDFYVGTSKYIKALSFEVSSYPNQLGVPDGKHIIGDDCNPACFIYEILTSRHWGAGKAPASIDVNSFLACAQTLHTEELGMSMVYNGASTAEDQINDILRHVDGVVFTDPQTGLITMSLARDDYVVAELPEFGPDDFGPEGIHFSRPSWNETRNTLQVTFVDRANDYTATPIPFQDDANIDQRGGEISTEMVDLSGFTTAKAATAQGLRALKTYSYPLAAASGNLTRKAWKLRPASVIRLNWPELGINGLVMRVTRVNRQDIVNNKIGIDMVEDIFSIDYQAYSPPPGTGWINPVVAPKPMLRQALVEAPFYLTDDDDGNLMAMGSPDGSMDMGFDIMVATTPTGLTASTGSSSDHTASAVLSAAMTASTAVVGGPAVLIAGAAVTDEINTSPTPNDIAAGDTVAVVKGPTSEEWISYNAIDLVTGEMTGVRRGLFDTVPQAHPIGSQVWFPGTGFAQANPDPYVSFPQTLYAKLLPTTALGTLDPLDATTMSIQLVGRASRPFPPGRIRVNNTYPPLLSGSVTGTFTYSWANRNRNLSQIVTQDDAGVAVEANVSYTIRVYDVSNNLLVSKSNISPTAQTASITLAASGTIRVEIVSVRAGLESWQKQSHTFAYTSTGGSNVIAADEAQYVLDGGGANG